MKVASIRFSAPPPTVMLPVLIERSALTDSASSVSTERLSVTSTLALAHPATKASTTRTTSTRRTNDLKVQFIGSMVEVPRRLRHTGERGSGTPTRG